MKISMTLLMMMLDRACAYSEQVRYTHSIFEPLYWKGGQ